METTITAQVIHADFYSAEERLYVSAIGVLNGHNKPNHEKADRLKKLGFTKAKPINQAFTHQAKLNQASDLVKVIEYMRVRYPQYKYITEAEVKTLCQKYGLIIGDAEQYTGDIPEKNLKDIEQFRLFPEDWSKELSKKQRFGFGIDPIDLSSFDLSTTRTRGAASFFAQTIEDEREIYLQRAWHQRFFQEATARTYPIAPQHAFLPSTPENKKEIERKLLMGDMKEKDIKQNVNSKPYFKICAPPSDFNTSGHIIVDGHKLVYDPIVLQPMKTLGIFGYLIVTAWGDEASDELVINQANN